MIYIYRFLINIIIIISPFIIIFRLLKKKEDLRRFKEKFTFFSKKKNKGKLIWFHSVSVGELISIVPLIKVLEKNNKISQILVTSSTLSSANLFKKLKFKKTVHQFFPIDGNFFVKRFLNYWSPKLAIFIDSEIWPNMLVNLEKNNTPRILLNARISFKSYKNWKLLGSFSRELFQSFNFTYPQNLESKKYLKILKVKNIKEIGNLKFAQNDINKKGLSFKLKKFFKSRKTWCAASTHPGEEKICADIHKKLLKKHKNLLLIIIPRHINRIVIIKKELTKLNLSYQMHSKKKLNSNASVYIVDTYGEADLFYDVCKYIFMGKSITVDGGQNPLEPARNNCKILHGPKISNFKDIYSHLNKQKIAFRIKDQSHLYIKIKSMLNGYEKKRKNNKLKLIGKKILIRYVQEIKSFIN